MEDSDTLTHNTYRELGLLTAGINPLISVDFHYSMLTQWKFITQNSCNIGELEIWHVQ